MINRLLFPAVGLLGALAIFWMGQKFWGGNLLALAVVLVIAAVYGLGWLELMNYRRQTNTLREALLNDWDAAFTETPAEHEAADQPSVFERWLDSLPAALQPAVLARIEGERGGLPVPVFTPYLVGLLVMLGLLGTFFGMVDTLSGAVVALDGNSDLAAIRSGLAAPIAGLGVAFGTSVAGIAASAALGLCSVLCRRERMLVVELLDAVAREVFPQYDRDYRQLQAFDAIQAQAEAFPAVAQTLEKLSEQLAALGRDVSDGLLSTQQRYLEQSSNDSKALADTLLQLNRDASTALADGQASFNASTTERFEQLAGDVGAALEKQVAESSRLTGESLRPIFESTLQEVATHSETTQLRLVETTEQRLGDLAERISATTTALRDSLTENAAQQSQAHSLLTETFVSALGDAALRLTDNQRATLAELSDNQRTLLNELTENQRNALAELLDSQRASLGQMTSGQREVVTELTELQKHTSEALNTRQQEATEALLARVGEMLASNGQLIEQRVASEAQWLGGYESRMAAIASSTADALAQLRDAEAERAAAAVSRLEALEATVTEHLGRLGAELEAPMSRLIETASETPRAAADVITRLREELSNSIERDNALLEERQLVLEQLQGLMNSMDQASVAQQESVASLAENSSAVLARVSEQFSEQVDARLDKMDSLVGEVATGAVEVASLSEALESAVRAFGESNDTLVASLERVEQALDQSSARSDEQLGYYVAQAREIIDHSVLSQKEIIEGLRQLGKQGALFDAESEATAEAG